jgi:chromosome partitioning protein
MTKVVAFVNLKGGVGKTTLAVNFAAFCVQKKERTLLIDVDPQTNASLWVMGFDGWEAHADKKGTVADLMGVGNHKKAQGKEKNAADVLAAKTQNFGFDLIPSHLDLFTIDFDLASAQKKVEKLKEAIVPILGNYDVVVIDCPPNLTVPTQSALAFATHFVVPTAADFLSAIGIALLINRVQEKGKELDNSPALAGVVISKATSRPSAVREKIENAIRKNPNFGAHVLEGKLVERTTVMDCTQNRRSVFSSKNRAAVHEFTMACKLILDEIQEDAL